MDNPRLIDEEDIPMVQQDDDYDDYSTPNTSRTDETSTPFLGVDKTSPLLNRA